MTTVNSQITDAVTQSNVKVIAESPAFAMSSMYQTLAHSTGILFENAVAAQQQQNTLALAASNQGVMQIYSVDTTAAAGATEQIAQTGVADNLTSLLTVLNAFNGIAVQQAAVATAAETTRNDADAATNDIADQIQAAVKFSNDAVLGNLPAFAAGLRSLVDAMAHAIDTMNRVSHDNLMHMLQEAALASTLAAMIREPGKAAEYEAVLQAIKRME
jgi:Killing trait